MTETELYRYARIYEANPRLARAGVDYGDLLDDPGLLFRAATPRIEAQIPGTEFPPLLPAQARIAKRIRDDDEIARAVRVVRDDCERSLPWGVRHTAHGFIEPLAHHAYGISSERCRQTRPLR